ncbi:MAG: DUF362 domain-containing protein [Deltaproteobacteria bacterium]|nr:DUF362 domain-containing protein [Deltaproteobacteria bacterium]
MKSNVYFADLRAGHKENLLYKLSRLIKTAGMPKMIKKNELAAIKLHFGEPGNTSFIRPVFIKKLVEDIKKIGAYPFLTDANTLYSGERGNSVKHLHSAVQNGFAYSTINAPIIIADGLRGKSEKTIKVNLKRFKEVYIGKEIIEADFLLSAAHFKGHELSGFGGTIKNLGMGCASRRGKLAQHSTLSPAIKKKKCIGCAECAAHCSRHAISIVKNEKKNYAAIDQTKCIGCGECIIICANDAVQIQWNQSIPIFLENMTEYTAGVLQNKKDKAFFINFIIDVSPACDCYGHNDAPIVQNIGILASKDPVAIDQASVDLVNKEQGLPNTCLKTNLASGEDKFKGIYPQVDWEIQLEYAEEIGLGYRNYELIKI